MVRKLIFATTVIFSTSAFAEQCVIFDPSGTPLNVRNEPNGPILRTVPNGMQVDIIKEVAVQKNTIELWSFIADSLNGAQLGWVFSPYIRCVR